MGVDEQKEEREVLDSIFPDEITDISDTSYRVSIRLDVPEAAAGDGGDEESAAPVILLNVTYPDAYPDVAPHLDITSPSNSPKYPFLDVSADKARLLEGLQASIDESLGMAMIFTLVTSLKESAEQLIIDRRKAEESEREAELRKAEAEENRKFEGTKVTRETFLAWRDKFRQEMAERERQRREEEEAEDKKKGRGKVEEKKLTGRQLWEKGLAKELDGEPDAGADALEAVKALAVS